MHEFLTVPQAARLLQVSRHYIYTRAQRGEIPSVKVGFLVRIPRADLERWLHDRSRHRRKEEVPA